MSLTVKKIQKYVVGLKLFFLNLCEHGIQQIEETKNCMTLIGPHARSDDYVPQKSKENPLQLKPCLRPHYVSSYRFRN